MELRFTAIFEEVPEGYIAYVAELPGANAQGATLVEARANLEEAVELVMDANRTLSAARLGPGRVVREPLEPEP